MKKERLRDRQREFSHLRQQTSKKSRDQRSMMMMRGTALEETVVFGALMVSLQTMCRSPAPSTCVSYCLRYDQSPVMESES